MRSSVVSGANSSGSMWSLGGEENSTVMSSEGSCSYLDESELELELGLGGGGKAKNQYLRILTAEDFVPAVSPEASSSASSSSSPVDKTDNNGCFGTKRTAIPSSPPRPSAISSQVAGWPPIGTYRMNSLVNHFKSPATGESVSTVDTSKTLNSRVDRTINSQERCNNVAKVGGLVRNYLFVKVNMDGISIGRKIDVNAHSCYETLALTLGHMFTLNAAVAQRRNSSALLLGPNVEEQVVKANTRQPALLLDGSSDFALTYQDKDGDWMLVGDVPWEMFLSSVRRLRIRRTSEVNGLAPRSYARNRGQLKTTR